MNSISVPMPAGRADALQNRLVQSDSVAPPDKRARTSASTALTPPVRGASSAAPTLENRATMEVSPPCRSVPNGGTLQAAFLASLADDRPAVACVQQYFAAAANARQAAPLTALPFVPPNDTIAVSLLSRVEGWLAVATPSAAMVSIHAGCQQRLWTAAARALHARIERARAHHVRPSNEIFVRFNMYFSAAATGAPLAWLGADDARCLLRHSGWSAAISEFLTARAGVAPRPGLLSVTEVLWDDNAGPVVYAGTVAPTGVASGYGVATWPGGVKIFRGCFAAGASNGWGLIVGSSYRSHGEFKKGLFTHGTVIDAKGDCFVGQCKDGIPDRGVSTYVNGDTFNGQFSHGLANGRGIQKLANGVTFAGYYWQGLAYGHGTQTFANGDTFEAHYSWGKVRGPIENVNPGSEPNGMAVIPPWPHRGHVGASR